MCYQSKLPVLCILKYVILLLSCEHSCFCGLHCRVIFRVNTLVTYQRVPTIYFRMFCLHIINVQFSSTAFCVCDLQHSVHIFVHNSLFSHPFLINKMYYIGCNYKVSLLYTDVKFDLYHRRMDWSDGFLQLIYISQLSFQLNEKCEIFRRNKSVANWCEMTSGC